MTGRRRDLPRTRWSEYASEFAIIDCLVNDQRGSTCPTKGLVGLLFWQRQKNSLILEFSAATLIVAVLIALALAATVVVDSPVIDKIITVAGICIGIISLAIMIRIANNQNKVMMDQGRQIDSLDKLNDELQARKAEHDRVKALFLSSDDRKYTFIMPVEYRRRPLPTIAAGDYYAWHVIQNFVGDIQIDMCLTSRLNKSEDEKKEKQETSYFYVRPWLIHCWITLPHGYSSMAITSIIHKTKQEALTASKNSTCRFGSVPASGWFSTRSISSTKEWDEKVICYFHDGGASKNCGATNLLISQSDEDYIVCDGLKDNEIPETSKGRKCDLAVIIRASRRLFNACQTQGADDKIFVIAGIHQYGTWIAADFLQQFCRGKRSEVDRLFKSEADFALLVYGQFNDRYALS